MALEKLVSYLEKEFNEYCRIEQVRYELYYNEEGQKRYDASILVIHYSSNNKKHQINRTKLNFKDLQEGDLKIPSFYLLLKCTDNFALHTDC